MARRKQAWTGWGAPMHRIAGWDFDHRLNGYVTTAANSHFSCDCGEEFPTPSGYRKCGSCGRAWNSYVIGTDGHGKEASLEKVIVREIPVRKDVIVASKRRRQAGEHSLDKRPGGDYRTRYNDPAVMGPSDVDPMSQAITDETGARDWPPLPKHRAPQHRKSSCDCWEGYERVPGTKPCAEGSCRKCDDDRKKKAARRYVAWCRQVNRMPNTAGFRRFRTAERIVRRAASPRRPANFDQLHPMWGPGWGVTPEHIQYMRETFPHMANGTANQIAQFSTDVNLHGYDPVGHPVFGHEWGPENPKAWNHFLKNEWGKPWNPGEPGQFGGAMAEQYPGYDEFTGDPLPKRRKADRHELRRRDLKELDEQNRTEDDDISIEHFSSRRRRAELFDVTDEGETRKGKGKSDTPTMRKNPADWTKHKQNGQFTKRWN